MIIRRPELKRTIDNVTKNGHTNKAINTTKWIAEMNRRKTQTNKFSGIFCCYWIRFYQCSRAALLHIYRIYKLLYVSHQRAPPLILIKSYRHNIFISMHKSIKYDFNNSSNGLKWSEMAMRFHTVKADERINALQFTRLLCAVYCVRLHWIVQISICQATNNKHRNSRTRKKIEQQEWANQQKTIKCIFAVHNMRNACIQHIHRYENGWCDCDARRMCKWLHIWMAGVHHSICDPNKW